MPAPAQVRLPKLISSGMVLQRNAQVRIWGWAGQNEKVTVHFNDSVYAAAANERGEWQVTLYDLKPAASSTMRIMASDTVTITNIAVGDVWVCSGQSNMELPMSRVRPIYEAEIAHSANRDIRQFIVPQVYNFTRPQSDLQSGSWKEATPENILSFSAAAYFFAKELYEKYHVPIGLINASLGGSPAQAWMSAEALKHFPAQYEEAQKYRDTSLIVSIDSADRARFGAWYGDLRRKDEGYKDVHNNWSSPELKTTDWPVMKVPGYWAAAPLGPVNGVVWFRREFAVPKSAAGAAAKLTLGRIVDADSVFVNGRCVGTTSYQYPPRRYEIPPGLLTAGTNTIVVRVISNSGIGGFVPDKQYDIRTQGTVIDLKGNWHYKLGAVMDPLASQTFIRWKPVGLFNGMLSPLLNYRIKGVIWYQGESNASQPGEYAELFPSLIRDWRSQWQQGEFPFIFMQLPNFMEAKMLPPESNWALMREVQFKTLSVPYTGMAVGIDIGEWNDIHPLNKKDVGRRLALAAERVAYGDTKVVSSGPLYDAMTVSGRKAVVTFTQRGSGLVARGGKALKGFVIADSSGKFVLATAKIRNNTVEVWNDGISHPVAVRYAWADNPAGANLYNKEGLPASPFRTDTAAAK